MVTFQAAILGLVQGLTEFMPISSSAHLIIVPWLLGWNNPILDSLQFDVALHMGTLLAVVVYFAADWVRLVRAGVASLIERRIGNDPDRRLVWLLVIGCIPGAIAGVLGESAVEQLFHKPNVPIRDSAMIVMALIIAFLALLLLAAERLAEHIRRMDSISLRDALLIGVAQAFAIFPGVSRSGSTITAGLAVKLERDVAARFSFLLGAPIIAGAGLKSFWDIYKQVQGGAGFPQTEWILFAVGVLTAAISGFFCIRYLLRYLRQHSTDVFVYYRWALAVVIVLVALLRR